MRSAFIGRVSFFLSAMLCLVSVRGDDAVVAPAFDPAKVSTQELIHDTQRLGEDPNRLLMVWWIPTEYWQVALSKNPNMTAGQIDDVVKSMSKYTVIAVADGSMATPGAVKYDSEAKVRDSLKIKDQKDHEYSPVDAESVEPDTQSMIAAMKPVMAGMLGAMGKHMYFILFPVNDSDNHPIADARSEGKFTVTIDQSSFGFRLPLQSLVAKKECPTCHEKLPGSYKFCPYDGAKLD